MNRGNMFKQIGILTSGGDCPGLNAAIRSGGKPHNPIRMRNSDEHE
jgi:hypothetical protein